MKKITKLTSLILTLALILGLTSSLTACKPVDEVIKSSFNIMMPEENNLSVKLMSSEVTTTSEGYLSKTLTATVSPATNYNQSVNWSVAWKNADSTWASGKSVTDYIEVVANSQNSLKATVTCKKAFGEQINVTVSSALDSSKSATCVCDYRKRLLGLNDVKFGISELKNGAFRLTRKSSTNTDLIATPIFSDFTYENQGVLPDFNVYMYLYQDFVDKLENIGIELNDMIVESGGVFDDPNSIHANEFGVVYLETYMPSYSGNLLKSALPAIDASLFEMGSHTELNNLFHELGTEYDIGFIVIQYQYGSVDESVKYPVYLDESVTNLAVQTVALASNNIIF